MQFGLQWCRPVKHVGLSILRPGFKFFMMKIPAGAPPFKSINILTVVTVASVNSWIERILK